MKSLKSQFPYRYFATLFIICFMIGLFYGHFDVTLVVLSVVSAIVAKYNNWVTDIIALNLLMISSAWLFLAGVSELKEFESPVQPGYAPLLAGVIVLGLSIAVAALFSRRPLQKVFAKRSV